MIVDLRGEIFIYKEDSDDPSTPLFHFPPSPSVSAAGVTYALPLTVERLGVDLIHVKSVLIQGDIDTASHQHENVPNDCWIQLSDVRDIHDWIVAINSEGVAAKQETTRQTSGRRSDQEIEQNGVHGHTETRNTL